MKIVSRLNLFLEKRNIKFNYVDVRAREDVSNLWKKLEKNINVFGFETDPDELKKVPCAGGSPPDESILLLGNPLYDSCDDCDACFGRSSSTTAEGFSSLDVADFHMQTL